MRNRVSLISLILACIIAISAGVAAASGLRSIRDSSESPVPDYIDDRGQLILDKVPAYLPVSYRDGRGRAGYAAREDLYREEFQPELLRNVKPGQMPDELDAPVPVYAKSDGSGLVGHLYTEVGFVGLDEERRPGFDIDDLRVSVDLSE